jgi:hypothetical protein
MIIIPVIVMIVVMVLVMIVVIILVMMAVGDLHNGGVEGPAAVGL